MPLEHPIGAHEERFKNIEKDIEVLFDKDKDNVLHRLESVEVRATVKQHSDFFIDLKSFRKEQRGWFIGIIVAILGGLVFFGGRLNALDRLEKMHPIMAESAYAK